MNNPIKGWMKFPLLAVFLMAAAPSAWATVYVRIEPPALRLETYQPRHGYVWQSGYWRWRGQQHVWTAGHYARQKNGQHWTDGRWERHDRGYYWTAGRWDVDHHNGH